MSAAAETDGGGTATAATVGLAHCFGRLLLRYVYYAMWGDADYAPFWGYGYNDIYAGVFTPYGYDDLAGYLPPSGGDNQVGARQPPPTSGAPDQLAQMCGEDNRDIAGLPIDQIQQAVQPNDAQRAALDDLANASAKAAQDIKAAVQRSWH